MPYYDYCKANGITPFIDLNWKYGRPPVYKDDITTNKDGIPLCPKGFTMENVHLVLKDNPRLFNNPPRDSAEWKLEYNARSCRAQGL